MTPNPDRSRRFRSLVLPLSAQAKSPARSGRDGRLARRRALVLEPLEGRTLLTTPTINFANGFAGATGLNLNGGARISGAQLQLSDGNPYEARSAFYNTPVNVNQFTTTFDFQISPGPNTADGFTFTIQNNSRTAVGGSGGALGYSSSSPITFPNSLAVKFDLYDNAGEGSDSTGVYTDGAAPILPADDLTSSGVDLHSGDPMAATIAYSESSQALSLTITDLASRAQFTKTYAEDLTAALGSSTAYVGFTAGTGGLSATQTIQRWIFTTLPTVTNESAGPVTATGATLIASVSPNGQTTAVRFQYSADPTFTPTVQTTIAWGGLYTTGVAVDGAGDVFVADAFYSAVIEVLPDGTSQTIGSGFSNPLGVAVDNAGDVFVADDYNNTVKEVLPDGTIKTIGSGFHEPYGVAVDAAGDIFVADFANNAVKEVLPGGTIQTIGSGFSTPCGVAVDAAGDVFVADSGNDAVKEVMPGGTIKTIGSGFRGPCGVAVDAAGDVFVADTGHDAVKEVLPDRTVQTIGPWLGVPRGVAVDAAGDVFVADFADGAVKEISPPTVAATPSPLTGTSAQAVSGTLLGLTPGTTRYYRAVATSAGGTVAGTTTVLTTPTPPTVMSETAAPVTATGATLNASVNPNGQSTTVGFQYSNDPTFTPTVETTIGAGFSYPSGVAVNGAGDVFVADQDNHAVKEVLPDGTIQTIGSGFDQPFGVAVDAAGDVFVADLGNTAVKEVLPDGTIQTIGYGFSYPYGVAVDAAGDVFVADTVHNAVKEVLPGGTIQTIGSGFNDPTGVAVDGAGDVFVADFLNNAVKEVLPDGTIKTIDSGFSDAYGVAVDTVGDVFIPDTGNVKEVLPSGTIKTIGLGFNLPNDVAVDAAGDVFVADTNNNAVKEISPPTVAATPSLLTGSSAQAVSGTLLGLTPGTTRYYRAVATSAGGTVAGTTTVLTAPTPPTVMSETAVPVTATGATLNASVNPNGQSTTVRFQYSTAPTFAPTVVTTIGFGFGLPTGVAVDNAGDVFVADYVQSAIKEVLPGGTIQTIGSGFSHPTGVAVDGAGDVFVTDSFSSAVKEVLPDGTIQTIGSGFYHPWGVAVDGAGDVFVADTGNSAVKEVLPDGTTQTIGSGFDQPFGVAVDAAGDVFVSDTGNHAVKEVLPGGAIKTIDSGFFTPYGVAVDAAGDVFVAEIHHRLQPARRQGSAARRDHPDHRLRVLRADQRGGGRRGRRVPRRPQRRRRRRDLPAHGCHVLDADRHIGASRLGHADGSDARHVLLLPHGRL
jgi:trehalose utilization protein